MAITRNKYEQYQSNTNDQILFDFVEALIAAGWEVDGSGDAVSAYELNGSTTGVGTGSGGNYHVHTTARELYNRDEGNGDNIPTSSVPWLGWVTLRTPAASGTDRHLLLVFRAEECFRLDYATNGFNGNRLLKFGFWVSDAPFTGGTPSADTPPDPTAPAFEVHSGRLYDGASTVPYGNHVRPMSQAITLPNPPGSIYSFQKGPTFDTLGDAYWAAGDAADGYCFYFASVIPWVGTASDARGKYVDQFMAMDSIVSDAVSDPWILVADDGDEIYFREQPTGSWEAQIQQSGTSANDINSECFVKYPDGKIAAVHMRCHEGLNSNSGAFKNSGPHVNGINQYGNWGWWGIDEISGNLMADNNIALSNGYPATGSGSALGDVPELYTGTVGSWRPRWFIFHNLPANWQKESTIVVDQDGNEWLLFRNRGIAIGDTAL